MYLVMICRYPLFYNLEGGYVSCFFIAEQIIATYYCIEFGIVEFGFNEESHIFTLSVYDNRWIDELNINVCMDIIEEYLNE
jgi:hypothetical protein